jgi:hypothetical protein
MSTGTATATADDANDANDDASMAMETDPSEPTTTAAVVPTTATTTEKSKPERWIAVHPVRNAADGGGGGDCRVLQLPRECNVSRACCFSREYTLMFLCPLARSRLSTFGIYYSFRWWAWRINTLAQCVVVPPWLPRNPWWVSCWGPWKLVQVPPKRRRLVPPPPYHQP